MRNLYCSGKCFELLSEPFVQGWIYQDLVKGGGGGGGAQVRCCVSHVHRPSPIEAGVTVVGIFASLSSLV